MPSIMKEIFNENQRKKGKSTLSNIALPDMIEECDNMILRYINVNKTESNQDTLDKVIDEYLYDTSPAMMEIFVIEDNMNEGRETGLDVEEG